MERDVAITGMSGRFPGAESIQQFWTLLEQGFQHIEPSTRWDQQYSGGFLKDIDQVDAPFFHLSPKEARFMDPQQRLLLEAAWLAFEDAGFSKETLRGQKAGVFVTSLPGDYKNLISEGQIPPDPQCFTGNAVSLYAGRISYFFDLKGPSLYIDTACSSGLVCMDQAVRHLKDGTIDVALVGGVSLFSTPQLFQLASAAGILSKTHSCRPFDSQADGFVPAEMVVAFVLQRTADAHQTPYGIVHETAVGHDGLTNGIMAPNSASQEALLKYVYQKVEPETIGYLEAHGTGTQIGDPIELNALRNVFLKHQTVTIGSLKANIGHGLVASGLASVVKALGIFQTGLIPPQPSFEMLNPSAPQDFFQIPKVLKPFPRGKDRIGVSAFGFGGTNAHVVLERFPKKRESLPSKTLFNKKAYWIDQPPLTYPNDSPFFQKLCQLLGYDPNQLPLHTPLSQLGVDSLVILQLLEHLEPAFKSLPPDQFFSKTVNDLLGKSIQTPSEKLLFEWVIRGPKDAPALVLLPPLNTLPPIFVQQIRFFQQYRLLIPHYPGHGRSPFQSLSLEALAKALTQDLEILGVSSGQFIGWSLGGCLSLLISLQQPSLITSLSLVGTAARFEGDLFGKAPLLKKDLESYVPYLRTLFETEDPLERISAKASLEILGHYYQELASFSILKGLLDIRSPCLIVHGTHDAVIQAHHLQDLKQLPNARVERFENQGPFVPLTAAWVFNQKLHTFLKENMNAA